MKKTTKTDGDFKVTTSTYADGSISITGAEQPTEVTSTGDFGTMAIKDCTTQTGSGYQVSRGCTVYATKGVIEFNFRADYSILQGSGNDKIIAVYNDEVRVVGGTASGRALVINRQNETSAQVAEARLSADITIGTAYTGTSSLYLQVGRNTAISKSTL